MPNSPLHEKSVEHWINSLDFETIMFPVSFPQCTSMCVCTCTDNTDIFICLYIIFSGSSCSGEILGIIKERILHAPADGIHFFSFKAVFFFPLYHQLAAIRRLLERYQLRFGNCFFWKCFELKSNW